MPDANYRSTIQYPRHRFQRGIIRGLVHFLFFLLSDFRIEGKENLPKSGPLLLVGNHFSFIDPVSFIRVAPYPLEFIGGNQMPNAPSYLTWLTNTWDVIRVYRGNATLDGLRQAEEVLKQDGVLAIFPEAGNWADVLRPARPGAAFLAARTQAPLLPIGRLWPCHAGKSVPSAAVAAIDGRSACWRIGIHDCREQGYCAF